MAISNANKALINKMNRAAQLATLGTAIQDAQNNIAALQGLVGDSGTHTVTTTEVANTVTTISTDLVTTISGVIASIFRSNNLISNAKIEVSGTDFTVKDNSTDYVLSASDVVNWMVF